MNRLALALPFAACLSLPGNVLAEEGRYFLEKVTGGYVRLNTETGEVAFCQEKDSQFVCRISADEREAYEADIGQLSERIDRLEERIAMLESMAPGDRHGLSSEEDVEKTLGIMERFLRGFMGIVRDLEKEYGDEPAPEAVPEKT